MKLMIIGDTWPLPAKAKRDFLSPSNLPKGATSRALYYVGEYLASHKEYGIDVSYHGLRGPDKQLNPSLFSFEPTEETTAILVRTQDAWMPELAKHLKAIGVKTILHYADAHNLNPDPAMAARVKAFNTLFETVDGVIAASPENALIAERLHGNTRYIRNPYDATKLWDIKTGWYKTHYGPHKWASMCYPKDYAAMYGVALAVLQVNKGSTLSHEFSLYTAEKKLTETNTHATKGLADYQQGLKNISAGSTFIHVDFGFTYDKLARGLKEATAVILPTPPIETLTQFQRDWFLRRGTDRAIMTAAFGLPCYVQKPYPTSYAELDQAGAIFVAKTPKELIEMAQTVTPEEARTKVEAAREQLQQHHDHRVVATQYANFAKSLHGLGC